MVESPTKRLRVLAATACFPRTQPDESPEEAVARLVRHMGGDARICILGGTKFNDPDSEALVQSLARQLSQRFVGRGCGVCFVTGGMEGVQKCFAQASSGDVRLYNLLPEGQTSGYGRGEDVFAGKDLKERMAVYGLLGDVYITVEGGPGVASEARAAAERGAGIVALRRTGGASGGMFEFPTQALQRPAHVSEEQWERLGSKEAPIEESAAAAVALAAGLLEGPFPLLDITSPQTLEWCRTLPPPPEDYAEDVFVCSYPKSGTTWLQHIVGSLVSRAAGGSRVPDGHVSSRTPFFEIDPHWAGPGALAPKLVEGHGRIGRRMFNTHLRWEMMPRHSRARYIYVCRDGRDACCSFFHHLSSQRTKAGDRFVFEGSFADFHAKWVAGKVEFGRWTDHLAAWGRADGDPRVLFLSYEDMLKALEPAVQRIIQHLGLRLEEAAVKELLPTFSFDHMKANRDNFQPVSVQWKEGFEFMRKGTRGDHSNLYSPTEQQAYEAELCRRFPAGMPAWAPYGTR